MLLLSKETLKKLFKVGSSLLLVALVSMLITTVLSPSANAANYPDKDFCEKYGGTWTENRGDDGRVISYTCNGAPSRLVEKMSPTEELTSFSLYTGIADCIGTRMYGDIQASATDNSNVAPSKWFNYGTFISIGDLYKTADVYSQGEKKCDAMVTQALDMWGYGDDYSRFLRDMGYTFNRDTLNWHGSADGGTRYREFQDILKNQVYPSISGSVPALSKAAQYLENLYFFQKSLKDGGCAAYDLGEYPDLGGVSAYKRWVDQNYVTYNDGAAAISAIGEKNAYIKYSKVQIIGTDRKSTPHGFAFYFGPTENDSILIDFFAVESSRTERGETCDQIAKNVSNFSTDYFGWLALNPESQVDGGGNACTQGAGGPNCPDEPATSCVIDGIGWIVCPVLNAIGGVSDAMYGWISSILLLNPLQMNDENGDPTPQYTGWKTIRDISNVLLVIVFLIIIFSQITSIGVTNYGIKKLLPRVILVAVLVNVSFLVMMVAIDVVNLIGTSLYNILVGLAPDVTGTSIAADNAIGSFVTGIVTGSLVGAGVTIAGGIIGAPALALLAVPFIIVAVLALFAAIATLFVRNALVIILVLLAPLAFAAFLLPNTKSLFDRWRKLTVGILFLYPTAALLFGGTKFAAYTLANDDQPLSILVAVFVMAAPLGLLPWLAASSGGILGTIGGRLQGLAKSARSPLQRAFKSRVDNQRERYQSGQNTLFGRRRSQAEFDQRQIDTATGRRRRNWGERLNQAKTSRDTDTENAKATQKTNVNERGLVGTSRRDQRFGDINRQAERLSDQKASQAADYRQQVDRMIATPGTVDAQRQARKFDAEQASEGYNATTKLRNEQRIINNVASTATGVVDATGATINLGDQATATFGVNEEIKAAEGDILRINRTSGVAAAAVDRQKENEEFLKGLDADEQAAYDQTLDVDPARRARAIQTADSQLTSARVRSEVKSESDARTDVGGPMFQEEMRRRAAEKESNTTKGRLDTFQTEAATNSTDPHLAALDPATRARLQASDRAERISGGALNSAQRVAQRQFDQDIIANPALATQIGGIDPLGASRAEAEALQREKEALDRAVAAEYKRFETGGAGGAGEDPNDLLHMIASGNLPRGGGVANEEQIEAAIQYIAENGTVDQQMLLADVIAGGQYHDFTAPGVVSPAGRAPIPPRISQAYGIANKKSKLQSTSGTNSNRYNTNQPVPGYTQQIIERAQAGKHTVEKWAGMDVDEMRRFSAIPVASLTSTPPTPTEIAGLAADAAFLREALADKDIKAFDFEKTGYLHTILANLEAAAGIPATPPPTR